MIECYYCKNNVDVKYVKIPTLKTAILFGVGVALFPFLIGVPIFIAGFFSFEKTGTCPVCGKLIS